jgi:hypothetical protein
MISKGFDGGGGATGLLQGQKSLQHGRDWSSDHSFHFIACYVESLATPDQFVRSFVRPSVVVAA